MLSGTGYGFNVTQTQANSGDTGDTCMSLGHKILATSGTELVIRSFALSTENNLNSSDLSSLLETDSASDSLFTLSIPSK
jgi:hypothetical protein